MKLYYTPGACSLSPHIALFEAGQTFDIEKVDLRTKKTESGKDYTTINPKGYVPALQLDDGTVLTEGPAIVQFIADKAPQAKLAPANGTLERYRLQETLNFIGTELHKPFGSLFNPALPEEAKTMARNQLANRLKSVNETFGKQPYFQGEQYSVADAYLFTVLSWAPHTGVDLSPYTHLKAFQERVGARPQVQAALKAEGLLK
ncbi:glutathione transferase GstA [Melittangium boletus]|uniref:Glutathione S-transferase n=1 Tax=Melittangium boletus DSM 14713 TaxID=1294270 RepID=A0A250I7A3_9BACT|nr:glutathione transferase GstA [Melittangium boletus]ATB27032.1 glutathione S-transferase [Melittangium boletus DSM 14713]